MIMMMHTAVGPTPTIIFVLNDEFLSNYFNSIYQPI
jgi:hypothetical protein